MRLGRLLRFYLGIRGLLTARRGLEVALRQYPMEEVMERAKVGVRSIYPMGELIEYGKALLGAEVYEPNARFHLLDKLLLVPPAFTPLRLKKMLELGREPTFLDVSTETFIGGFRSRMPVVIASMGSPRVVNEVGVEIAMAAAKFGVPMGIGENVATMWGYDRRTRSNQPSFKERLMCYLENVEDGMGGVFIQQSVEDAHDELWNKIYSDPDVHAYIEDGLVSFEIKIGQGAKPGLGGEVLVDHEEVERLSVKYQIVRTDEYGTLERHSAPGTFTPEILRSMIRSMRNNYPRCRLWVKLGPFRDVREVVGLLIEEGVDCVTVDGREGGTGMSPVAALRHLGLPLTATLIELSDLLSRRGRETSIVFSGRMFDGGHVVKCLCLGADGVAMGRPIVLAAQYAGQRGVENFLATVMREVQMLISALGKYSVQELSREDLASLDKDLASSLGLKYAYSTTGQVRPHA